VIHLRLPGVSTTHGGLRSDATAYGAAVLGPW